MEKYNTALFKYLLFIADNSLILGHRLSEWCGHGPSLETDIALTNIALDLVGHARSYYQYAAELNRTTEDDLAYLRDVRDFRNLLLLEQPNGNFADTIARQFFFDAFNYLFTTELCKSKDEQIASIAQKALKEVAYHYRFSAEWAIRLGDGTAESKEKMQMAINNCWPFTDEMFASDAFDEEMSLAEIGVDLSSIQSLWMQRVQEVIKEAQLTLPEKAWMHKGGKKGIHSEHLGFILADMQWMQRAYPGMEW